MEGSVKKKKPNNLPKLAVALVVLLLIAFAVADPLHLLHPTPEKLAEKDPTRKLLLDAKRDEITALEIKPLDSDAFRIEKEKDHWYVTYSKKRTKADMDRVDKLLDALPGLRADSLATEDPKQYDAMEVSDGKAIMLKVYKGGVTPVVTLSVGKATPSYQSCFVRVDQGKEVWRAGQNLKSLIGYSPQDFRTKKPWAFKAEAATKLMLVKFAAPTEDEKTHKAPPPAAGGPQLAFELKDGLWKVGNKNGNQNAIKEFLNSLTGLQISEYVDKPDPAVTQLTGRSPSIAVSTAEGDYTLTFGAKDGSYWYAQDQEGNSYKLSDYTLNFYKDLDWSKLTFDDAAKAEAKPGAAAAPAKGAAPSAAPSAGLTPPPSGAAPGAGGKPGTK